MHNYCKTIGALAAASALAAGNASAEVEYEMHLGYTSEYIFRGQDLGDDLGEFGLDAATEYNGWGLSGGFWGSLFDSPRPNTINSEFDYYGEVSRDLGFATAAVGYIYYHNTAGLGADKQEVYFSLSRDLGFATAALTYYWDVDHEAQNSGNEGYTTLALSKSWELNECLTLNVDSTLGYLVEQGQIAHWTNKVSLDYAFVERAKISPFIAFSLEGNADDNGRHFWNGTENELYAGSMLSVSF